MRAFLIAILAMGLLRFLLTVEGQPDSLVQFFSMSVIIASGALYFAISTSTHKERLKAAYLLVLPYMIVEVSALGYTWKTGRQTIFQSAKYTLGYPVEKHAIGHFVGGLTWEPLGLFLGMEVVWLLYWSLSRLFSKTESSP